MRAILDLRSNTVLRVCGSVISSMRTYAMMQVEREKMRKTYDKLNRPLPALLEKRLAIAELTTTRHIGDTVPTGEFTIIHAERNKMPLTEKEIFEAEMQKEFNEYCNKERITSQQYRDDIQPVFEWAYKAGTQNMMLGRYTGENGI